MASVTFNNVTGDTIYLPDQEGYSISSAVSGGGSGSSSGSSSGGSRGGNGNNKVMSDMAGAVAVTKTSGTPFLMVDGLQSQLVGCGLLLVNDIMFKKGDIAIPVAAVNDERFIYVFGQNFGEIQIKGSVYLGPASHGNVGKGLSILDKFYEKSRVAKGKKGINVSLAGAANIKFKAYIRDVIVQRGNPDTGEMKFVLAGWIAPTPTGSK